MKNNLFFRLIAMLLVVVMLGTMIVACNNGDTPDTGKTPSGSEPSGDNKDDDKDPDDNPVTPPAEEEEAVEEIVIAESDPVADETDFQA